VTAPSSAGPTGVTRDVAPTVTPRGHRAGPAGAASTPRPHPGPQRAGTVGPGAEQPSSWGQAGDGRWTSCDHPVGCRQPLDSARRRAVASLLPVGNEDCETSTGPPRDPVQGTATEVEDLRVRHTDGRAAAGRRCGRVFDPPPGGRTVRSGHRTRPTTASGRSGARTDAAGPCEAVGRPRGRLGRRLVGRSARGGRGRRRHDDASSRGEAERTPASRHRPRSDVVGAPRGGGRRPGDGPSTAGGGALRIAPQRRAMSRWARQGARGIAVSRPTATGADERPAAGRRPTAVGHVPGRAAAPATGRVGPRLSRWPRRRRRPLGRRPAAPRGDPRRGSSPRRSWSRPRCPRVGPRTSRRR
jgi:hypothetical protein